MEYRQCIFIQQLQYGQSVKVYSHKTDGIVTFAHTTVLAEFSVL